MYDLPLHNGRKRHMQLWIGKRLHDRNSVQQTVDECNVYWYACDGK
jgi:hypothetical protein